MEPEKRDFHIFHSPPCSRYEGGESNPRCVAVFAFVAGLVGGRQRAVDLQHSIARLHDHKGKLVVALHHPISASVKGYFRRAWEVVGNEPPTEVDFCDVRSPMWASYWSGRRFESTWTPDSDPEGREALAWRVFPTHVDW